VQRVLPGQRVIPLDVCGTWQEYMVVRESELLMVPEGLDDTLAAQFFVNPLTAWIMTTDQLAVEPGAWLLQTAAASTLGRMVVQIARIRGFRTINVVRRRTAVEDLKVLGADEVICTAEENLVERVKILTGGVGVPAAIDAVGGEIGSQVVRSLAADGMLLIYGALALEPIALSTGLMIFRSLQVRGFWLSKWLGTTPMQRQLDVMSQVLDLMTQGKLAPSVAASYDLGAVHDAVLHAEQAGRKGKILLRG
jgi:NADPH2:quinone reductase